MSNIFKLGSLRAPTGSIEVDSNFPDIKQWPYVFRGAKIKRGYVWSLEGIPWF